MPGGDSSAGICFKDIVGYRQYMYEVGRNMLPQLWSLGRFHLSIAAYRFWIH